MSDASCVNYCNSVGLQKSIGIMFGHSAHDYLSSVSAVLFAILIKFMYELNR